ncbi:MAG TPA: acyl-CoA dehydrogenase family protein [Kofleriaceae bacterium]|nr:acyl-CoA dehydrogenase family protein [Kofleriaceae bacterium]
MHFDLNDDQRLIQRTAREFAERVLMPRAAARDLSGEFPVAELHELAQLGLLGIAVPDGFGGAGAGTVAYSLAMQELARGDATVAVATSVTNMVAELITRHGSPEIARAWVPGLIGGQFLCGAFALSEPEVGSDPASMRMVATRTAGGWRLSGTKQWTTNGSHAGCLVVWAVTEPGAGHKGITAFVVPGKVPGLTVSRLEDKLGLHGSSTAQLVFDGVELGDDAVLGKLGGGFALAMTALDGGRIGIASQAIGIATGAFEAALRYAGERRTFGEPIIKHQAVGGMLADAATWLDAARLMTLRAAFLKESGQPFSQQAAMAKLFASEHAWKICDIALQVHGGYGYVRDFPVERALRDVRVTRIYEGTSEIQRLVIARNLLR